MPEEKVRLKDFTQNYQEAESLANFEMISPELASLHNFSKKANENFKDKNQKDLCEFKNKKTLIKRFTQTNEIDLFIEELENKYKNIELFLFYSIEQGKIHWLGYKTREQVDSLETGMHFKAQKECKKIMYDTLDPMEDLLEIYIDKEEKKIDKQNYSILHLHTEYSIGDGFGKADEIAENLYNKGIDTCAITDHGNLMGAIYFQKELLKKGIKPIIGIECYLRANENDETRYHLTLLVKNEQGWKNLLKLNDLAVRKNFYYKPIFKLEEIKKYSEGLICGTACANGPISKALLQGDSSSAEKRLKIFKSIFEDDLFVEIMPTDINFKAKKSNKEMNIALYNLAKENKVLPVFTNDVHYPNKEDIKYHKAIKAISYKSTYEKSGFDDNIFYIMKRQEILDLFEERYPGLPAEELINNTNIIAERCNFQINKPDTIHTLPKFKNGKEKLKELTLEGLKENTPYEYKDEIKERIDLELNRFISKGYEDYFLIVHDYVKWCKKNDVMVGPGRGSCGSSLVAYALNITEVDPIKFDLLFNRFISEVRKDMPDIDLDFDYENRHKLWEYLDKTYGDEYTAKMVTFSTWHGKGALRDAGRIFDLDAKLINTVAGLIIQRSGGDARKDFCLLDTFTEFYKGKKFKKDYPLVADIAMKLEGRIRHLGQHAAGYIITDKPISEYVPIFKIKGEIVTAWEKKEVENMNLIKFDILGLRTLSIIRDTLKLAKLNLKDLPKDYEDKNVYNKIFKPGKCLGVFQFETSGLSKLSKQIGVDNFASAYDTTSLYRPGPLHCITGDTKIKMWNGKEKQIKDLKEKETIISSGYAKGSNNNKVHKFFKNEIKKIHENGIQNIFLLKDEKGNYIKCTDMHHFYTRQGWKRLKDLKVGDEILINLKPNKKRAKELTKQIIKAGEKTRFKKGVIPKNKNIPLKNWSPFLAENILINNPMKKTEIVNKWKKWMLNLNKKEQAIKKMKNTLKEKFNKKDFKDKHSLLMKEYYKNNKHPNEKGINISKPQRDIFEVISKDFPEAIMEYPIKCKNTKYFADIAIPSLKLDIEFDGDYWHKNPGKKVIPRDSNLEEQGWKVIRVTYKNIKTFLEEYKNFISINNFISYKKIKEIKKIGKDFTYDITTKNQDLPNYIANNFIVHNSGLTADYTLRNTGKKPITYDHPLLEPITKDTKGIIIYQEQVMQIMFNIGNFTWATAESSRKIMTKSKGKDAFNKMRKEFVENALKKHKIPEVESEKLFDAVSTFGCLTGDTKIYKASSNQYKGREITIQEAFDYQKSDNFKHRGLKILSMSSDGFVRPHDIKKIHDTGIQEVFYIKTVSNNNIKATEEHRFLINGIWKQVKDIQKGDYIEMSNLELPHKNYSSGLGTGNHEECPRIKKGKGYSNELINRRKELINKYGSCQHCGSKVRLEMHHFNHNIKDNSNKNTILLCRKCHKKIDKTVNCSRFQRGYYTHREKILEIKRMNKKRQTYDIEMIEEPRNFIANNFVSHNSYGFNKCISKDTKILIPEKKGMKRISIEQAYKEKPKEIFSYNSKTKKSFKAPIKEIVKTGKKEVFEVLCKTNRYRKIKTSKEHKFYTRQGWKKLEDLKVGDEILLKAPSTRLFKNENPWEYSKILNIESKGIEETYDIHVNHPEHNYIANMFVVHNSHAVEYSIISYWCAWLKTYYQKEFFLSLLFHGDNERRYITDAKELGMEIYTPDINNSKEDYSVYKDGLIAGFTSIKEIGNRMAKQIIKNQPYNNIEEVFEKISPSVIEKLAKADALKTLEPNMKKILNNLEHPENLSKQQTLFGNNKNNFTKEFTEKEKLLHMQSVLDMPAEKPVIDFFDNPFEDLVPLEKIKDLEFEEVIQERWVKGMVTFINFKQEGLEGQWTMFDNVLDRRYAHLNINDGTGDVLIHLSPEQYTYYKNYLERKKLPVLIKGHSIKNFNKIYCDAMIVLDNIDYNNPIIKYIKNNQRKEELEELRSKFPFWKWGIIDNVTYKVSKKKRAYARIKIKDDKDNKFGLMCFKLDSDLFISGEIIGYQESPPFIKIFKRYK